MKFPDEYDDEEKADENIDYIKAWMNWLSRLHSNIEMGYDDGSVLIDLTNSQDTHDFVFMLDREEL